MKTFFFLIYAAIASSMVLNSQAQTTTTVTTSSSSLTSSANNAVNIAKAGVDAALRDRIISVYGVGTPAAIQTWWVIFYDPGVVSHGRAVKVENGRVTRSYEAKGNVVNGDTLTFSGADVTGEGPALAAAQNYAAQNAVAYDHVRALLRITAQGQAFRWRVQLLDGAKSKGFVFVNATDGTFAMYSPPGTIPTKSETGGVAGDLHHAGDSIKDTFLGIGGDLQEFFTGERTVDQ